MNRLLAELTTRTLGLADHPSNMTAIDDLSTVGDEDSSMAHRSVEERIAYLNCKLEAEQAFFREQIAEWKSSAAQLEHENRTLKDLLAQQDKEEVVLLREQITDGSSSQEYTAEERNAFLKGTLEAQKAFCREQIAELKSTAAKSEATHVKAELAKQAAVNKAILQTAITNERTIDVPMLRTGPIVWKSSASSISTGRDPRMIDVLDFPGLQEGISTWKIKILRDDGVRLGVVSSLEKKYEVPLGESEKSWSYGGLGDACHNNCRVGGWHVGFTTGSIVTLSLDLTGRGALSVSVDEKPLILVFDGMKKGNEQFIPAVFLYNKSSCIEFRELHQFNPTY
jgi:hypothetical protein